MGRSVIGSTTDFDSVSFGSSPDAPATQSVFRSTDRMPGFEPGDVGSIPARPANYFTQYIDTNPRLALMISIDRNPNSFNCLIYQSAVTENITPISCCSLCAMYSWVTPLLSLNL